LRSLRILVVLLLLASVTACDPICVFNKTIGRTSPLLFTDVNGTSMLKIIPLQGNILYEDPSCPTINVTYKNTPLSGNCIKPAVPYTPEIDIPFKVTIPNNVFIQTSLFYNQILVKSVDNKNQLKCHIVYESSIPWHTSMRLITGRCVDISQGRSFDLSIPDSCPQQEKQL
jgi:hypothetical protein